MAAAMTSFQTHGFKACTIEEIAGRAGVFKGSFYNHFRSKEALGVAAIQFYVEEALKTLPLTGAPSPLKRLRTHFETIAAAQMQEHSRNGCLLANFGAEISEANPQLRSALDEGMVTWYQAVTKVIRQAQAKGEIGRRHQADRLARFLVNAWEGAAIRTKVTKSWQPLEDFFAITFEEILVQDDA